MADFDDDGELTIGRVANDLRELAREHGAAIQMQKMVNDKVKRIMERVIDAPGPRLDAVDQRVDVLQRSIALSNLEARPAEPRIDRLEERLAALQDVVKKDTRDSKMARAKAVLNGATPSSKPPPPADQVYRGNASTDLLLKVERLERVVTALQAEVSQHGVNMISLAEGLPGTGALQADLDPPRSTWEKLKAWKWAILGGMLLAYSVGVVMARW